MRTIRLKNREDLLIESESGNEYLVHEAESNGKGGMGNKILFTEKQPKEVWKRKQPRWPSEKEREYVE